MHCSGALTLRPHRLQVFPDQLDLRPNSTAVFRVTFRPPADGQYYTRLLDVVAYVKAQRSFRLVGESAVLAPFTTTLQVRSRSAGPMLSMCVLHC